MGCFSNYEEDDNNNENKQLVLYENNCSASASRLRRETSRCDVLWRMWTCDDKLSFLYLNIDKVVKNSTPAFSMRSRRVEVVDERENGRARETRVSPSRASVFSCTHYFQAPATLASLHLTNCAVSNRRDKV